MLLEWMQKISLPSKKLIELRPKGLLQKHKKRDRKMKEMLKGLLMNSKLKGLLMKKRQKD